MGTASTFATAQGGYAVDQIAGFLAGSHQVVREGDMNRSPAGGAEKNEHGIAPAFPEGIRQAAELGPILRRSSSNGELDVADAGNVALERSLGAAAEHFCHPRLQPLALLQQLFHPAHDMLRLCLQRIGHGGEPPLQVAHGA